jgi:hypothetical protein
MSCHNWGICRPVRSPQHGFAGDAYKNLLASGARSRIIQELTSGVLPVCKTRRYQHGLTHKKEAGYQALKAAEHTYPSTFTVMHLEAFLCFADAPCLGVID